MTCGNGPTISMRSVFVSVWVHALAATIITVDVYVYKVVQEVLCLVTRNE